MSEVTDKVKVSTKNLKGEQVNKLENKQDITVEEATEMYLNTLQEFGVPVYYSHIPVRIQKLVPLAVRREALANAQMSEGWVKELDGTYHKGRLDYRTVVLMWARDNVYSIVTVKDIAEATGASQNIVRELTNDRPDIFRKSEGRTYEIRDPQEDRQAQKKK